VLAWSPAVANKIVSQETIFSWHQSCDTLRNIAASCCYILLKC